MRRDAALGDLMHVAGADLHLDAHMMRADHRRMERPIVVLLGRRDIVLEAAGHGAPGAMRDAERAVAFIDAGDDDAEAENIGELAEREMLALHLAPDRIRPLLAA